MDWITFHKILTIIQGIVSFLGAVIIFFGVLRALSQYAYQTFTKYPDKKQIISVNTIRLKLGKDLLLGLEFIVAADLIGTTTTPDYYSLGLVAGIVAIRTLLSFTINRELMTLKNEV